MLYEITEEGIYIKDKSQFNPEHTLECGQVFCFEKVGDSFIVYPQDKYAEIMSYKDGYLIKTTSPQYFIDYFDLKRDYNKIKENLLKFEIMKKSIEFGYGIRILNQDLFEVLVSFIISANNNIKRIKMILNNFRLRLGKGEGKYKSFPSLEDFSACDEQFFRSCGAGYRASYLVKLFKTISVEDLEHFRKLDTLALQKQLIALSGVGPKVADCVMLFGYKRGDVFPVDTWINKVYNQYFSVCSNRAKIRVDLIEKFGQLSGYAQQYLFYYQRSSNDNGKNISNN